MRTLIAGAKERGRRLVGERAAVRLRCILRGYDLPQWGNLRRTAPLSAYFGFERGTPIDRYYLDRFLAAHRDAITGDVLEVQVASYTKRFGHDVTRADTVDVIPRFHPTYLCDLARAEDVLPADAYDCVLLPNTLPHVRDLDAALRNVVRVLRGGGVLLASAAGLLPLTPDAPEYWRFSPDGWRERLSSIWPPGELTIDGHGNCLAAIATQLGLAQEELTGAELDVEDPRYPVLTTIAYRKPLSC